MEAKMIVNKEYIIPIESDNDILRIAQSNFSYISSESKYIFRYESITEKITERYFQRKPLIDLEVFRDLKKNNKC